MTFLDAIDPILLFVGAAAAGALCAFALGFWRGRAPLARRCGELAAELEQTAAARDGLAAEMAAAREKIGQGEARQAADAARLEAAKADAARLASELGEERRARDGLAIELERARTALAEREATWEREKALMKDLRASLERDFKALAGDALNANNKSFLQHADEIFKRHAQAQEGAGKAREDAIRGLVKPMQETLQAYQTRLAEIEKARQESYGGLQAELKQVASLHDAVRNETSRLVNALRAAPKTRGRWGEETLKNILELAGMSPYCDFTTEHHIRADDGGLRPDVLIRLPADRHIIIDAKTSTEAFLAAHEAVDDAQRESGLARHAKQLRAHMDALAKKKYHAALETSLDFTVMFVPGENLFAAAMERDPALFQDALAKSVIITTPTTLIPLLKAISMGWREEALAENAREVAALGRELHARLAVMGGHIAKLGQNIEKGVKSYNDFVGSLETKVMVQARRFEELEVADDKRRIEELRPVELDTRELRTEKYADLETRADPVKRIAN